MKTLFLSPHFDDLFLSVFARLSAAGEQALAVYPFAQPQLPGSGEMSYRWEYEELPNLRELGCAWHFLGRDGPEETYPAAPAAQVSALATSLSELLAHSGVAELVAPLGIGGHPDHLVCTLAALHAVRRTRSAPRLTFYSDIPYCLALPLLRGGPLQLSPQRWLHPQPVQVAADRKLTACLRYASQLAHDGTCQEILRRASCAAVTLTEPLAIGPGSYECAWEIQPDRAELDQLIQLADQKLPLELEALAAELLPVASDDTPFFSPAYAGREQRWSAAIQAWARVTRSEESR